jgi:hypothetical protein
MLDSNVMIPRKICVPINICRVGCSPPSELQQMHSKPAAAKFLQLSGGRWLQAAAATGAGAAHCLYLGLLG